jgi:probable HAF family extracellular repeat protein
MQDLGALEGHTESEAVAINNRGDVVGHSIGETGTRAFLWTRRDGMQDLGTLPSGDYSRALANNDRGDVVGTSTSSLGLRAVIWTQASDVQDLNSLIPAGAGFVLAIAVAVNAQGAIVALGHVDAGDGHGHGNHDVPTRVVLLVPRP